jgi:hypothetical protein
VDPLHLLLALVQRGGQTLYEIAGVPAVPRSAIRQSESVSICDKRAQRAVPQACWS